MQFISNFKFRFICTVLFLGVFCQNSNAQKRYKQDIFSNVDSITNIKYGAALNIKGEIEELLLDVILPANDTVKKRPLLIFIHGGGFKDNTKTGVITSKLCNSFAKKGYVTATINYRLKLEHNGDVTDYHEAMYRAQQDGKAAIRFFRRYAEEYGIDTAQIFITGTSAGCETALAIAYMDENEIPKDIDQKKWGSLDGASGNSGYSSKVKAVINNWGALIDYKWIQKGDVPLFNIAGTMDKTVPYDSSFDSHGFKYGAYILYKHCLSIGVSSGWRPFIGAGHTLDNNRMMQDSAINDMAAWLYTQLAILKSNNEGVFRFEGDMKFFDSLNLVEHHSDSALLFLGSSFMRYWTSIRKDIDYPDVIHRGFGGCNMRDVAYYVDRVVYPHHPKAIFMYVGNDIVDADKDKSPEQVFELFKFTIEVIRRKFPTTPITWLQVLPSEKRWGAWDKIQKQNQLIEDYCKANPYLYMIRCSDKFIGDDGLTIKKYYKEDKLHPNDLGYKVWGNAINQEVKRIARLNNLSTTLNK